MEYKGKDMFIIHHMGVHEVPLGMNDLALKSHNKMHVGYPHASGVGFRWIKKKLTEINEKVQLD